MTTATPWIRPERRYATHGPVLRHHGVMPNRHDAADHAWRAVRDSAPATWSDFTTPGIGIASAGDPWTGLPWRFPVPGSSSINRKR